VERQTPIPAGQPSPPPPRTDLHGLSEARWTVAKRRYQVIEARIGAKEAREAAAIHRGPFQGAEFPLAIVQIDHTPLGIILVDETARMPIGRPWLTLAIDVFSRMVTGYDLTFDPPGRHQQREARTVPAVLRAPSLRG
jgi:transposase InsO family protein